MQRVKNSAADVSISSFIFTPGDRLWVWAGGRNESRALSRPSWPASISCSYQIQWVNQNVAGVDDDRTKHRAVYMRNPILCSAAVGRSTSLFALISFMRPNKVTFTAISCFHSLHPFQWQTFDYCLSVCTRVYASVICACVSVRACVCVCVCVHVQWPVSGLVSLLLH